VDDDRVAPGRDRRHHKIESTGQWKLFGCGHHERDTRVTAVLSGDVDHGRRDVHAHQHLGPRQPGCEPIDQVSGAAADITNASRIGGDVADERYHPITDPVMHPAQPAGVVAGGAVPEGRRVRSPIRRCWERGRAPAAEPGSAV
jgi:hypothetical protein